MPRVAIIGAGFAGLRCADVLLRNGVQVVIYEARNRLGGRVHQYSINGIAYDMGPNWIHGTEGNPIMEFARKTGAVIMRPEERQMIFDSAGVRKPDKVATELSTETWAIIVEAFKYSNEHCSEIDPAKSLMDYFTEEIPRKFPDDKDKVADLLKEARTWGPFIGSPVDRQSLRNFFLEECLEGENVFVASTYRDIFFQVAQRAQQEAEIRLNEEATEVRYREEGDVDGRVSVTTAHGDKDVFDEVVVTSPLGWLKRHQQRAFTPKLPLRLSQAIDRISYGNLEKIYVTFPSAWWMSEASEPSGSRTTTPTSADTTDQSTDVFIHFHHPDYHPDPASKENEFWNQSIVNLAHGPGDTARPTLLFYLYGPCSIHVTSMIKSHEPGSERYNALLFNFVEPFVSRLPFYSASDPACTPLSLLATQWSNDPYAGFGSYSNFQVGLSQGDEEIECLRNTGGLSDDGRGLWFAGEHTAPFVALGTTTGAYWSGEAVARRILRRHGVEDVKTGEERLEDLSGESHRKELNAEKRDGANLSGLAL